MVKHEDRTSAAKMNKKTINTTSKDDQKVRNQNAQVQIKSGRNVEQV